MISSQLAKLLLADRLLESTQHRQIAQCASGPGAAYAKCILQLGIFQGEDSYCSYLERRGSISVLRQWNEEIAAELLEIIPATLCCELEIIPYQFIEGGIAVAMLDPLDLTTVQTLRFTTDQRIKAAAIGPQQLEAGLRKLEPGFRLSYPPLPEHFFSWPRKAVVNIQGMANAFAASHEELAKWEHRELGAGTALNRPLRDPCSAAEPKEHRTRESQTDGASDKAVALDQDSLVEELSPDTTRAHTDGQPEGSSVEAGKEQIKDEDVRNSTDPQSDTLSLPQKKAQAPLSAEELGGIVGTLNLALLQAQFAANRDILWEEAVQALEQIGVGGLALYSGVDGSLLRHHNVAHLDSLDPEHQETLKSCGNGQWQDFTQLAIPISEERSALASYFAAENSGIFCYIILASNLTTHPQIMSMCHMLLAAYCKCHPE